MIHLCYVYRVIIGGNLARLISLDCHLPHLIHVLLSVENTGLKKLTRVRVAFIICLKLIIIDRKSSLVYSYFIQNYYLCHQLIMGVGDGWSEFCFELAATLTNYEIKKGKNKIKNKKGMETTKTIPKNKIKNKKRSTNWKAKQITLLLGGGGGDLSLFFSCYALVALQPSTITAINQDSNTKVLLSALNDLSNSDTIIEQWYAYRKVIRLSKSDTLIEKWYAYRKVIRLSKSDTLIEKWYAYRKVIRLSKSDTLIEKWYAYRKVIRLSKSDTLIEKWYAYRKVIRLSKSDTLIEKWYAYRKVIRLSKSDTLIEKWYAYRKVIRLSNSDTVIEKWNNI